MRYQRDGWAVKSSYAKDRKIPDWYEEEPELLFGEDFYIRSFWDLSTERSFGMSVGPIPWSKRREYAISMGLEPCLIKPFVDIIGGLDICYLNYIAEQSKTK